MLEEHASLSERLTAVTSPVLFGCRSGICGTCLIEVESDEELIGPSEEESEALQVYAEGNPKARLACQFQLTSDVSIRKIRPS